MISILRRLAYWVRTRPVLSRLALRAIPDLQFTRNIPGIGPFRLRLQRNRALWLREALEFEAFPFAMLRQLVRPGDVVYDCGANLGLYARYLMQTLGAGRVIAFEPDEDNLRLLGQNLALGAITGPVTVIPAAVSDEDGTSLFQKDDMSSASGTLDRVTGGEASVGRSNLALPPLTITVPTIRLDTVIGERGLPPADVIKVDVEGAAGLLLRGAARLLEEHRPSLLVELHGVEETLDVVTQLLDLGYVCAGKVAPHLDPTGFGPVTAASLPLIVGLYDVHFLVAVSDPERLPKLTAEMA
ncbi:MAG TPA: FkbM family methyltransferase [Thermoanaerobaculia bacterium]|jgi:FkbM family methyltransferase|nr:FkbM family methyltransferase [Thermoanaerobaculia bacterium]